MTTCEELINLNEKTISGQLRVIPLNVEKVQVHCPASGNLKGAIFVILVSLDKENLYMCLAR